ncbi:hypothetical protein L7F22_018911 [Adiantum nelumboides]|nr:hypothetical protein [Adiantum nelumboides]
MSTPIIGLTPAVEDGSLENAGRTKMISEIIANAAKSDKPVFSLEFFPPKTQQGLSNLYTRIARMVTDLDPAWIQITWGAGGSTQSTSLDLAGRVQAGALGPKAILESSIIDSNPSTRIESGRHELLSRNVCLHLTCTNVEKASLDETLDKGLKLGIRNILALRGDPPRGQELWVAADDRFQHATDLVRYIRSRHGNAFCIGVAAYPEMHPDAEANETPSSELQHLLAKQEVGADFIVTQLFYDVDNFLAWYADCRANGITIPIIPGVMPIQSYQTFRRVTSLCKAKVPQAVWDAIEPVRFDDAAVRDVGVDLTKALIEKICQSTDIRAFHICTLNLEKSAKTILQALQWLSESKGKQNPTKDKSVATSTDKAGPSSITSSQALQPPTNPVNTLEEAAATWDEFPNGRYGDARSPAFGQIDGYGVSLKIPPQEALRQWGRPTSNAEISDIFTLYLNGKLEVIPWCDCPILPETNSISNELLRLNAHKGTNLEESFTGKGWWTVGSQPSADGIDSSDPVFGFGPAHGYIFQKAFVEFFSTEQDMLDLEKRIEEYNLQKGGTWLSFFAGNRAGQFRTNVDAEQDESCAVTWGCFVGKEIVQTTIIERESFDAWREEAFGIWSEWESLFPANSPTKSLLQEIGQQRWLVTVIHHDYKDEGALWSFLEVR